MELLTIRLQKPEDVNLILGQAHFIKAIEDLHEALASSSPSLHFGVAFCESSGPRLIRRSGNDPELTQLAVHAAEAVGAGHSFVVLLRDGFPVNVLNALKQVPEVCSIFCATANPVTVVIAATGGGRAILGVVDGGEPAGVETESDVVERKALLRKLGYKL
jgi:adenosine/AMP kinase